MSSLSRSSVPSAPYGLVVSLSGAFLLLCIAHQFGGQDRYVNLTWLILGLGWLGLYALARMPRVRRWVSWTAVGLTVGVALYSLLS